MLVTETVRRVVLLGSTGSIGTQAVDVVERHPGRFRVVALTCGRDLGAIAAQAVRLRPVVVGVAAARESEVRDALAAAAAAARVEPVDCEVLTGPDASTRVAGLPGADVVLNGITGSVGLGPTLAALHAGHTLALANKESLVAGGPLVTAAAAPGQIVPVDSEHSAIAQCLRSGSHDEVARLVITASGGPFRGWTREQLEDATPAQALRHPTWTMGKVVTTNSATMVNKGLEVIEAHLLFDVPVDRIVPVVHPQSVVHSMVEFRDGATIAQCSPPDMRMPIALGLTWPERLPDVIPPLDLTAARSWTFEPLDEDVFPAVRIAKDAVRAGLTCPAVLNAANEVCVEAFHAGRIRFPRIVETVARVVAEHRPAVSQPGDLTLAHVLDAERWARARAADLVGL